MSLLGKILVVIQTMLALLFLGVQATLYQHSKDWRAAHDSVYTEYKQYSGESKTEIDTLKSVVSDNKTKAENYRAQVEKLNGDVEKAVDSKNDMTNQRDTARSDLTSLQGAHDTVVGTIREKDDKIREYLDRNNQLEDELKEANNNRELAQAQVARLLQQKVTLEEDLSEARKSYVKAKQTVLDQQLVLDELRRVGIPLDTIVGNFPPPPPIRGMVAGVDGSVQPSLVLLSVGSDEGVRAGHSFTVYRGDRFVGKVVVSRVMADSAGCRVLFTAPGEQIQQGDQAATVLE